MERKKDICKLQSEAEKGDSLQLQELKVKYDMLKEKYNVKIKGAAKRHSAHTEVLPANTNSGHVKKETMNS